MTAVRRFGCLLLPAFLCAFASTWVMLVLEAERYGEELMHRRLMKAQTKMTSRQSKHNMTVSDCFRLNSKRWLTEPRLGNAGREQGIDSNYLRNMVPTERVEPSLKYLDTLLSHNFCPSNSRLSNWKVKTSTDEQIELWTVRLLYLVIHYHQHRHSIQEAQQRQKLNCQAEMDTYGVGNFDFECQSAKFLLVRFYKNGIGANLRMAAVPALMAGLASDRVVLFINDSPVGPPFLQTPWTLSSCKNRRRDVQCFFAPSSPCVLTQQEVADAYQLRKSEMRRLFRYGVLPENIQDDRVLTLNLPFRPQRVPENLHENLYNRTMALLPSLVDGNESMNDTLMKATRRILDTMKKKSGYTYYGADSPVFQSLLLYSMRPNPQSNDQIEQIVKDILPSSLDFRRTTGLPIRASDKCGTESECMTFSQHIQAARQLLNPGTPSTIVVTTESKDMLRQMQEFISGRTPKERFQTKLIFNHHDVAQDTGFIETLSNRTDDMASKIMLSAMSSLRLQLVPRWSIGNCCSNFHLLLKDLLQAGCGVSEETTFTCLQDHPDPQFRVCCSWDKSPECIARRRDGHIQKYRRMSA